MLSRSAIFSLAGALALSGVLAAGPGRADDDTVLRVYMNSARVLKLDRPVSKVIVGNSDVADATVADSKTIVLTGRAFGTTNLVLLDGSSPKRLPICLYSVMMFFNWVVLGFPLASMTSFPSESIREV